MFQVDTPQLDPSGAFQAISTSDSAVLSGIRSVYVGNGGDLTVVDQGGVTTTFAAVPSGSILPIKPSIIKATGTTATGIVLLK